MPNDIQAILQHLSAEERGEMLAKLLEEEVTAKRYFIPQQAYDAAHTAFALPFVEAVVVRKRSDGTLEFLLAYRKDRDWDGWHIMGGHVRANQSFEEAARVIVRRELAELLGKDFPRVHLRAIGEVTGQKWTTGHPYWPKFNPISHVLICVVDEDVPEAIDLKWCSEIPENVIGYKGISHHREFLERVRQALTTGFEPIPLGITA